VVLCNVQYSLHVVLCKVQYSMLVPVGAGTGNSWICLSLSNQGGLITSFKVTWHRKTQLHPLTKQISTLLILQLNLYFLFCLWTSGCPSGDWETGLANPRFSLQLRRPTERFQGNMTQKTILYPISKPYNLQLWFYLTSTSFLITYLSFLAMGEWGDSFSFTCLKRSHKF
jgi:hypothetical protein